VVGYEAIVRFKRSEDNGWILKSAVQAVRDFVLLVPVAAVAYLASWSGWFISGTGYGADKASNPLLALWLYHVDAYEFHVGLRTPHSYQANPLTWLFMQRPTSMFYEGFGEGDGGCTLPSGCSSAITALPNPLIWLAAAAAILWIAYRWLLERKADQSMILIGLVAGYLPWLVYLNRTVFQFYTVVFEGWMMIALAFALRHWVISRGPEAKQKARVAVCYYLTATAAISLFFLPIWIGTEIPYWFWSIHMWLPSWI
jgi:dolichyl-phosphate-mannose--protein O-mannosyl transferase